MPVATDPTDKAGVKEWLKGRNKYVTGYCNDINKQPAHEGTKPKSRTGKSMPTCSAWNSCPCQCHYDLDKMFAMVGRTRTEELPNPEYVSPVSEFVFPTPAMIAADNAAFRPSRAPAPPNGQGTPPDAPEAAVPLLASVRTTTGRATRGGLELQVYVAIRAIEADLTEEDHLTPKMVGEWIADKYTIPTPSSGAIAAVWDRWTKMGVGTQAKKPVRFIEFTPDELTWADIERKKQQARTAKKSASVRIDSALSARPRS